MIAARIVCGDFSSERMSKVASEPPGAVPDGVFCQNASEIGPDNGTESGAA
jgi:hypothetical protein